MIALYFYHCLLEIILQAVIFFKIFASYSFGKCLIESTKPPQIMSNETDIIIIALVLISYSPLIVLRFSILILKGRMPPLLS